MLQCRCEALKAILSGFEVKTCFYMPGFFIPLYAFHTVSIFTVLMANRYVIRLKS